MVWKQLWWCEDKSDVWRQLWRCEDNYDDVKTTMMVWRQLWWCEDNYDGVKTTMMVHKWKAAFDSNSQPVNCDKSKEKIIVKHWMQGDVRICNSVGVVFVVPILDDSPHSPPNPPFLHLLYGPPPPHTTTTTPRHICTCFLVMAGQRWVVMVDWLYYCQMYLSYPPHA